jgi:hypothetical protein
MTNKTKNKKHVDCTEEYYIFTEKLFDCSHFSQAVAFRPVGEDSPKTRQGDGNCRR